MSRRIIVYDTGNVGSMISQRRHLSVSKLSLIGYDGVSRDVRSLRFLQWNCDLVWLNVLATPPYTWTLPEVALPRSQIYIHLVSSALMSDVHVKKRTS